MPRLAPTEETKHKERWTPTEAQQVLGESAEEWRNRCRKGLVRHRVTKGGHYRIFADSARAYAERGVIEPGFNREVERLNDEVARRMAQLRAKNRARYEAAKALREAENTPLREAG